MTDNFPDLCPRGGQFNWTSSQDTSNPSASTDWDNDGCKDDVEDTDDDNDEIVDDGNGNDAVGNNEVDEDSEVDDNEEEER